MATGLTLEQIKAMGGTPTGGLTLAQIKSAQTPVESKPGFFSSLVTDPLKTLVVKPGIRFGQALGNLIAPMLGATQEGIARANQQTRTIAGMEIEPQKAFGQGGARQITGDIAKTASYLYTGGNVGTVANQTLRGQILAGGLTGLKTGAVGGGAYSFGEAIQNAENQPAAVAYQTLFGTAAGGVTGGILGATLPTISAGLTKFKEYKNFDSLTEKLNIRNKEVFRPTSSQMADWTQAKVDPIKTFSQEFGLEKIPTTNNTLQLDEFISQTDLRYKAGAEGFNTILRNSPEVVSIAQREANALRAIENSTLTPSQKLTAKAKIQTEFVALRDEARKAGQLLGDDNVSVAYADNLKDRFWGATKYFGPEEASVSNEVNRKIGTAFKEGIEEVITDTNVREYNKKLQELIYLKDFLESRNGKVPGTGGKMLRYTLRTVGAITGGGGLGSVAGAITADQVAQAIASPTARTWLIRRQLSKLPPEVRQSLEQEAKQILENMAIKRAETLRLPPPSNASLANQGKPIPVVPSGVEYTGGDLAAQSSNRAISQEANPSPNMIDNINPILDNTTTRKVASKAVNVDNNLLSEARKYKSAEDFVKAQGKPIYHSTDSTQFSNFDPTRAAKGDAYFNPLGDGMYLSNDSSFTKRFGANMHEYVLPKDIKTKVITDKKFVQNEYPTVMRATLKNLGIDYWKDTTLNEKVLLGRLAENNPPIQAYNEAELLIREDIAPRLGIKLKPNQVKDTMQSITTKRNAGYDAVIYRSTDSLYSGTQEIIIPPEKFGLLKTKSQLTDIWNKANTGSKIDPLIQEAKKYKSAEEFVKAQTSATQYGDYTPALRKYGAEGYTPITKLGVKPDEMVTIYRGIDDIKGNLPRKINNGDFVTTDFDSALSYAGSPKDVVSMEVPAKYLSVSEAGDFKAEPFYTGSEYIYTKEIGNPITKSQLTDIWKKANKK